jgi:hypothetical protein
VAVDIAQLLAFTVKNKASDLHLSAGMPPMIRVDGDIKRINMPALSHKEVHSMVYDIMNDKQRKAYEEFFETDFSFETLNLRDFESMHSINIAARVLYSGSFLAKCRLSTCMPPRYFGICACCPEARSGNLVPPVPGRCCRDSGRDD